MPEFCTCGTQLVPDSLFCHKCGRPTREIVVPETVARPAPPPPPPPRPQAPPLNLRNTEALRTSLLVAIGASMLCFIPYLNVLAAGFFAVFFYRRRTGYFLSMEAGIWMGWITGLLVFVIMACLLTAAWLIYRSVGGFPPEFKATVDPQVLEQMTKLLKSGPDVAKMILGLFVYATFFSTVGGALGAKMVGRD